MSTTANIFLHPESNGFTLFTLGILFILSAYHFLLYFQNKDRTFLFYSFYTMLIFLRQCFVTEGNFVGDITDPWREVFYQFNMNDSMVWLYNCVYFIFVFNFVDYMKDNPRRHRGIMYLIKALLIVGPAMQIVSFFKGDGTWLTHAYYFFFIPVILVLSFYSIYAVYVSKSRVRNYALAGSIVLLITSLATEYLGTFHMDSVWGEARFSIFYIGIIVENLFFSLGLGYKQKVILQYHNDTQRELIKQYEENDNLRDTLNKKLQEEVINLEEATKQQEIHRLKAEFEQQLAELKLASLQSQMNPHFIFNSLNSIKAYIIQSDTEKAVTYLNTFAKLMRKILAESNHRPS